MRNKFKEKCNTYLFNSKNSLPIVYKCHKKTIRQEYLDDSKTYSKVFFLMNF